MVKTPPYIGLLLESESKSAKNVQMFIFLKKYRQLLANKLRKKKLLQQVENFEVSGYFSTAIPFEGTSPQNQRTYTARLNKRLIPPPPKKRSQWKRSNIEPDLLMNYHSEAWLTHYHITSMSFPDLAQREVCSEAA
ncbi:hypothetical protein T265_10056 [Opisthorchis viverrini]|uniref:Uncharacterized protein n=1 Tax=Opisthorchis viverrini TaxID=6198 RepID=A0A074Z3P5_OPIVI|nr:hypothetical protein T265_10056 [Opisthorchis viverrini]KER21686.1 hypothetical protein T265_10056 [Opisthorchis viverrini]